MIDSKLRKPRLWTWMLGGLGVLGTGLAACTLVCSLVIPVLLALGVSASFASGLEARAGIAARVLVAVGALVPALGAARWWRARRSCRCGEAPAQPPEPVACRLDGPGVQRRLAEFRDVFARALVGTERLADGVVRWRFQASPGLEDELRSLAEREHACCRFFRFDVRTVGREVWWDSRVERPEAAPVLEELFALPTTLATEGSPPFWPGRHA